jgi:signal peptidase I
MEERGSEGEACCTDATIDPSMTSPFGDLPPRPRQRSNNDEPEHLSEPSPTTPSSRSNLDFWATDSTAADDEVPRRTNDRHTFGSEPPAAPPPEDDHYSEDDDLPPLNQTESRGQAGKRLRRVTMELVQTLVLAALIFLMVRGVAQNFRVEGPSMEPGLHNGQYLLVNKAVYFKLNLDTFSKYVPFINGGDESEQFLFQSPKRGDVIVFRFPNDPSRDFIKRIIGVPGDVISMQEGVVFLNGVPLEEPYITHQSSNNLRETEVPPHSYFVLGDNRANSSDSRNWGFVPEENIIGKAMFSYWPLSELGGVGNRTIDLGIARLPLPIP